MRFDLVDRVLESSPESATTLKAVSMAEEYLQDHFPGFPVLPGVFMLEAMVQAARVVASSRGETTRLTLGEVRGLKYNRFVSPGCALRVRVELASADNGTLSFKGSAALIEPGQTGEPPIAATGRFTLRPVRVAGGEPSAVGLTAPGA
ncbi:MAG: 3-hydroxyacyl-ACP dehydratase FabZ family protein [Phycisphaerales bacterium JB041]